MLRTTQFTVEGPGPDEGKVFILHRMPAEEAEIWCTIAGDLMEKAGAIASREGIQGAHGLAAAKGGPGSKLSLSAARALQDPQLDGIWKHIEYKPKKSDAPAQKLRDDHIDDWRTRIKLRVAFLNFHTDFFSPENPSTSG